MLEAEYLIFCKSVSIEENGVSLLQTLDTIYFTGLPTVYSVPLVVVAKVRTKKEFPAHNIEQEIKIEQDGKTVFSAKKTLPGRHTPKGVTLYFQADLYNLKFDEQGKYHVSMYIDGAKIIRRPLNLEPIDKKEEFDEQKIIQETN